MPAAQPLHSAIAPFQGTIDFFRQPRALPWAVLLPPFRRANCGVGRAATRPISSPVDVAVGFRGALGFDPRYERLKQPEGGNSRRSRHPRKEAQGVQVTTSLLILRARANLTS